MGFYILWLQPFFHRLHQVVQPKNETPAPCTCQDPPETSALGVSSPFTGGEIGALTTRNHKSWTREDH